MRRLMILGNCVGERLGACLSGIFNRLNPTLAPGQRWEVVYPPPVFHLSHDELARAARTAENCDIVFSQPLFSYGDCNTDLLRERLGDRLITFSAPNFAAYFPDVIQLGPLAEPKKFEPPMEWHSKIIIQCRESGIEAGDIEKIYLNHPLFYPNAMKKRLDQCWRIYEKRETGVDIGTLAETRQYYALEPLFHTFNHPGDRLLRHLLHGMLMALGISSCDADAILARIPFQENGADSSTWSECGFGFNAWPIITRHHKLFSFPGREWFRIDGTRVDITTAAIAWNKYYDAHPAIYAQALAALPEDSF